MDRIYLGKPADEGVDREFAKVVMKYDIPKELPLALLEGSSGILTEDVMII